jgi:hypothetical protein
VLHLGRGSASFIEERHVWDVSDENWCGVALGRLPDAREFSLGAIEAWWPPFALQGVLVGLAAKSSSWNVEDLLTLIRRLEQASQRVRSVRRSKGPRTIALRHLLPLRI